MGYFLGVLLLLLLTFTFCYIFNKGFAVCFSVAIFSLIVFLYFFGLFTILRIGAYIAVGVIVVAFIASFVFIVRKKNKRILKKYFSPAFYVLISYAIIQYILLKDHILLEWDEFSHWGTIVKHMFIFGNLGNISREVLFPGYPPATGIFHSFFMFMGNEYVEGFMYMSMNLLNFALILPIFEKLKKGFHVGNFLIVVFAIFIPSIFYSSYITSIYIDAFLGILTAYIIYTYFKDDEISLFKIVNISLALFVLCTAKASGLGLSLISSIIVLVDCIFFNRKEACKFFKDKIKLLLLLIPVLSIIIAKVSWDTYLSINKLKEAWGTSKITVDGIIQWITSPTQLQNEIAGNFIDAFFKVSSFGVLNVSLIVKVLILVSLILVPSLLKKDKRGTVLTITLLSGFIFYSISLLVLYIFTFTAYEATNLASFDRYLSSYCVVLLLLSFYYAVTHLYSTEEDISIEYKLKKASLIVAGVFAFSCIPCSTILKNIFKRSQVYTTYYEQRLSLEDYKDFCDSLDSENDKVYYIDISLSASTYYKAIYEVFPMQMNNNRIFCIGPQRGANDIQSRDIKPEVWKAIMIDDQYTHVYLHHVDDVFVNVYQELFERKEDIVNQSAFEIVSSNNQFLLRKISRQ
ncbi:MAG: hypothetical protein IJX18_00485 [Clostridia bacterium]|nr:hypothetical protein [Clostridia bacterium]